MSVRRQGPGSQANEHEKPFQYDRNPEHDGTRNPNLGEGILLPVATAIKARAGPKKRHALIEGSQRRAGTPSVPTLTVGSRRG